MNRLRRHKGKAKRRLARLLKIKASILGQNPINQEARTAIRRKILAHEAHMGRPYIP